MREDLPEPTAPTTATSSPRPTFSEIPVSVGLNQTPLFVRRSLRLSWNLRVNQPHGSSKPVQNRLNFEAPLLPDSESSLPTPSDFQQSAITPNDTALTSPPPCPPRLRADPR